MLIGLTGQIGAGKSTAARILAEFGACVIDADLIGKDVVENSPALLKRLTRHFGEEILIPSGKLNRKALAARAFSSDESKAALDALVHPYLLKELNRQVKELSKTCEVVVIDAALLLNWGLDKQVDVTIAIVASESNRVERRAAYGLSRHETLARQKMQLPQSEFRRRATYVVPNDSTRAELRERLTRLWKKLKSD